MRHTESILCGIVVFFKITDKVAQTLGKSRSL